MLDADQPARQRAGPPSATAVGTRLEPAAHLPRHRRGGRHHGGRQSVAAEAAERFERASAPRGAAREAAHRARTRSLRSDAGWAPPLPRDGRDIWQRRQAERAGTRPRRGGHGPRQPGHGEPRCFAPPRRGVVGLPSCPPHGDARSRHHGEPGRDHTCPPEAGEHCRVPCPKKARPARIQPPVPGVFRLLLRSRPSSLRPQRPVHCRTCAAKPRSPSGPTP